MGQLTARQEPPVGGLTVAFAGERGSFAEDAAAAFLGSAETMPVSAFRDVFAAVTHRAADAGVVPIENVSHGTVREVYDLLLEYRLRIVAEVERPVRLCLAALPGERLEDISRVYSHVQALAQAEPFLRSRPWTLLAATNTAGAGKAVADRGERGAAAVLSPRAARLHGLEIIARDVHADPRNRTRFLLVSRGEAPLDDRWSGGSARTTLALTVRNEPGSLVRALAVLAVHGRNISKLESRPSRERDWEYVFWIDVDGHLGDEDRDPAIQALRSEAVSVRLLGSYPARSSMGADGSDVIEAVGIREAPAQLR